MAIINLLNERGQEFNLRETIERYIQNTNKAKDGYMQAAVVGSDIVGSMDTVAKAYGEQDGAKAIHFALTFEPAELTDPKLAREIAQQIGYYIMQEYQVCFAVHDNTENLHIHFVFNSISYLDGCHYTGTEEEILRLINYIASVLYYYEIFNTTEVYVRPNQNIQ